MAREVELKLRISPTDTAKLKRHPSLLAALAEKPVTRKLTSIYYDTPQLALLDAGISLRVRRMSGGWFQAVKAAGHASAGLHQRMEWEDIIAAGHPDFSKITDPSLIQIFDTPALREALAPIFTTEVRRTEWQLAWENGDHVEVALDVGQLIAGDHQEPICEVELELKQGSAGRLFELALALQQDIPLQLENISKAQRGYAHYRPQPATVKRAGNIRLQRHMPADEAFRHTAWECLNQLQGNQEAVLQQQDIEGVHQMRVALRRLRSSFSVFALVLDRSQFTDAIEDLRWITGILGTARDLDVFLTETLPPLQRTLPPHEGLSTLRAKATEAQHGAYHDIHEALGSQRYHRLLLALGAMLENGQVFLPDQAMPITQLADAILEKRYKQLKRHGRKLAGMSAEERHAARIAAKKLRYSAEFFSALYPTSASHKFLRALAKLQDVLGQLNDIANTEALIQRLSSAKPNQDLSQALHIFKGWGAAHALNKLEEMDTAWSRFAHCKPFWQ
jgi:triphosphatase